jgi:peptide/nickel transport system permease protein
MWTYIARRLLSGLLLLFAITAVTFVISRLSPLDPACLAIVCTSETTSAQLKAARHRLGVDRPVYVQFAKFAWRLIRHQSFGASWQRGDIDAVLKAALPETASIVVGGVFVLLLLAIPLAIVSAVRAQTAIDRGILLVSIVGIAFHPFVIGLLLRRFFAEDLHLAPAYGYCPLHGHAASIYPSSYNGLPPPPWLKVKPCVGPLGWAHHLLLPWITFALFFLPIYVRLIRARILDALQQPHVVAARARGASELRILLKQVLRLALLPLAAMVTLEIGGALMAAIYIEQIYNIFGLGKLVLSLLTGEIVAFDLPLIAAIFFTIAAIIVVLNLIADLIQGALDPRVRSPHG